MNTAPLRRGFRWLPVNSIVRKGDHQHYAGGLSQQTVCAGTRVYLPKTYSRRARKS